MTLNRSTPMPRGEGPKRKARLRQGSPWKRGGAVTRPARRTARKAAAEVSR